jgi:hypothetical protein
LGKPEPMRKEYHNEDDIKIPTKMDEYRRKSGG